MKYFIFIFLLFLNGIVLFGQSRSGTSFRSGINRIGIYFDQSLNFEINNHELDAGLRFYGTDYVFEHDVVGLSLGYAYNFSSSNVYFAPGISSTFFSENKSNSKLIVSELMMNNKLGVNLGQRWSLFTHIGIGAVFNRHNNFNIGSTSTTSYINYEIALGIKFYWRIPVDD